MKTKTIKKPTFSHPGRTVIAIDVSGSTPPERITEFIKVGEKVAKNFGAVSADYYLFDDRVEEHRRADIGYFKPSTKNMHGGSNVCAVFERLRQWGQWPDLVIVVSDMLLDTPHPKDYPGFNGAVLWIDVDPRQQKPKPLFGTVINYVGGAQ